MKEYIWFDLGYTLLYLNRERAYKKALSEAGIEVPLDKIERGFHYTDKLFMRDYPGLFGRQPREVFMPWFIGRLNYELGIRTDIVALLKRWMEIRNAQPRQWEAYDFCAEALSDLRSGGYKLGLISNWDKTARPLLDEHELTDYFDTIIISSEVGAEKPSPEIFMRAFEASGTGPEQGCYVGDNYYDDGVGSMAVGIDYCIINRFDSFGVEELEDCRIISDIREVKPILEGCG